MTTTGATREYPKDPPKPAEAHTGPARAVASRDRTVPISIIHDQEIEKIKLEIAALVQRAREVELAREDPLADKPEFQFIAELQDIFRQVHKLNARWLADPGYEYVPPPAPIPQPGLEPAPPAPGAAPPPPPPAA